MMMTSEQIEMRAWTKVKTLERRLGEMDAPSMQGYLIDVATGTVEAVTYYCTGDWDVYLISRHEDIKLAYEFPWGDQVYVTDPPPVGCRNVRIRGLADDSPFDHEASEPMPYKLLVVGPKIGNGDLLADPVVPADLLEEWLEFVV
jgi:hypothetical protein